MTYETMLAQILIYAILFTILILAWLFLRKINKRAASYTDLKSNLNSEISELKVEIKLLNEKIDKIHNS